MRAPGMRPNPAREALTRAVNRAIANGAPIYQEIPAMPRRNPTPSVNCTYGAPLGRRSRRLNPESETPKFSLVRVRLDSGGYDSGGAYWGIGEPLWNAESDCGQVSEFFRASDRAAARAYIRREYGDGARFYR